MTSPIMFERVKEVPLVVEKNYIPENYEYVDDDSGFPFDNDLGTNRPFRSQLDDLASRHPQFADHLQGFPFTRDSTNRGSGRFVDRPFGDRFGGFFDRDEFDSFPDERYYQSQAHPQYSQQQQQQQQPEHSQQQPEEKDQERGRRPKQNIQQSNTVDLGQKQEPVDDSRNQRSMSAPPPDNRRFVSSINIPINPSGSMGQAQASQQQQPQANQQQTHTPPTHQSSTERVIPIHVEGRDEPVLPKSYANQQHTSHSQPQPQSQAPPQQQPGQQSFFAGHRPSHFTSQFMNREPSNRGAFARSDWEPSEWFNKNRFGGPKHFQDEDPHDDPRRQEEMRKQEEIRRMQAEYEQAQQRKQQEELQRQQQEYQKQQQEKFQQRTESPKPAEPPKKEAPKPLGPIEQIQLIQKDVSELMSQVEQFAGKPKDKQYLYLDEMLTRNLLRLDDIDTQGQDQIRSARKEAIRCIERCLGVLDAKANANVEKMEEDKNKAETAEAAPMETEEIKKDDTMEVDENKPAAAEEVAKVEESKTEEPAKMEAEEIKTTEVPSTEAQDLPKQSSATKLDVAEAEAKTDAKAEDSSQTEAEAKPATEENTEQTPEKSEDKKEKKKIKVKKGEKK